MDQLHFIAGGCRGKQTSGPGSESPILTKASLLKSGKSLHHHHSQSEIISLGPWQFQQWYILNAGHWFSFYRPLKSFQYLCGCGESSLGSLNNRFDFSVPFYNVNNLQKQPILQRSIVHLRKSTYLEGKMRWHMGSAKWAPASLLMEQHKPAGCPSLSFLSQTHCSWWPLHPGKL